MKLMKYILIPFLLLYLPLYIAAQTDIQMTQHMLSRINYNPAATGATSYVNIAAMMRQQWSGFKGAPSTQLVNIHNYVNPLRFGIGLSMVNDQVGLESNFNLKLSYAYHVWFTSDSYLSAGVAGGFIKHSFNGNSLNPDDMDDPSLVYDNLNKVLPDFDAGIEYNQKLFAAGLSVTHLNHSNEKREIAGKTRHYYAYTRFNVELAKYVDLHPAFYAIHNNRSTSFEVNTMAYYRKKYWGGVSYRFDDEVSSELLSFMAGLEFSTHVRVGYSYDLNIGKLSNIANNSHEIMLSFKIPKKEHKTIQSPRFFEQ